MSFCEACPVGTYESMNLQCLPCPAGTYNNRSGQGLSQCFTCATHYTSVAGSAYCYACDQYNPGTTTFPPNGGLNTEAANATVR